MAYPESFMSVTMNGTIASGNEIWSAGFHVINLSTEPDYNTWRTQVEGFAEEVADRLASMYSNAATLAPYDAPMTSVKFAYLGTDGKYKGEAIEVPVTARGANNTGYLPQGTLVTTLDSGKFKDPGKYNRFYLPILPGDLAGQWRLTSGQQTAYANNVKSALVDINDIIENAPGSPAWIVGVVSASGTGYASGVVAVRVGAIVDTQRRRRNKLPEAYEEVQLYPIP